ncbi:hypothetical protein A3A20_01965 [Candidatus Wolfebacteria bacterium RIFCSPLOWO2_01_FULL_45_19]|uniref:Uncharacterized protein n=1 Tax=Candidatus Wolfebacteria bacterium RIFCSPLOWO2_01_FULL_45_19 TaxID=1802557 RepID=A0A1F8DST4_9BACT|nr:MAG: hypothetical protein A3A20_01965 [Candidatus Wolfebacteria bacterium RIFCSPLOWO2_01_FULL_45_19]
MKLAAFFKQFLRASAVFPYFGIAYFAVNLFYLFLFSRYVKDGPIEVGRALSAFVFCLQIFSSFLSFDYTTAGTARPISSNHPLRNLLAK